MAGQLSVEKRRRRIREYQKKRRAKIYSEPVGKAKMEKESRGWKAKNDQPSFK